MMRNKVVELFLKVTNWPHAVPNYIAGPWGPVLLGIHSTPCVLSLWCVSILRGVGSANKRTTSRPLAGRLPAVRRPSIESETALAYPR